MIRSGATAAPPILTTKAGRTVPFQGGIHTYLYSTYPAHSPRAWPTYPHAGQGRALAGTEGFGGKLLDI